MNTKLKNVLSDMIQTQAWQKFTQYGGRVGYMSYTLQEMLGNGEHNGSQHIHLALESLRNTSLEKDAVGNYKKQVSVAQELMSWLAKHGMQRTFPPSMGGKRAEKPHYWIQ